MRLLETCFNYRKCLLPFVMAAAIFFVFQAITVPCLANPREPELSNPHKAKSSAGVVVKKLLQSPHGKTAKNSSFLGLSGTVPRLENPFAHIPSSPYDLHGLASAAVPAVPARAPPA